MSTTTAQATQVYQVYIRATPDAIWDAITKPEFTQKYFHGATVDVTPEERRSYAGSELRTVQEVLDYDPPRRLVHSWRSYYDPELAAEEPSRVTWEIEATGGRLLAADRDARPARRRAQDRRERLGHRLDVGPQRPEDAARDRRPLDR